MIAANPAVKPIVIPANTASTINMRMIQLTPPTKAILQWKNLNLGLKLGALVHDNVKLRNYK